MDEDWRRELEAALVDVDAAIAELRLLRSQGFTAWPDGGSIRLELARLAVDRLRILELLRG